MKIKEFITHIKQNSTERTLIWNEEFLKAGYYLVELNILALHAWPELHKWAKEHIGGDNYAWSGNKFWFERSEDALLFSLKWS